MPQKPGAIVTGAARGIGASIAGRLVRDGFSVFLSDVDERQGSAAAAALAANGEARFVAGDAGQEPDVERLVALAAEHTRLKAVICNAGIMVRKPVTDLSLEDWNRVLATNLTSTFLFAKHAAYQLRGHRGSIVTIASTRAQMSEADTEAYSASKGGLVALTHALAVSLGPEVRVNCVSPGWINTTDATPSPEDHAQHPAGRVGTPEDVAELVSYLVGPKSGFVTGANFTVDGGMTRKMIYV